MVTIKIMPCLDMKDGRVVKGVNFINLKDAGDPVETKRRRAGPAGLISRACLIEERLENV